MQRVQDDGVDNADDAGDGTAHVAEAGEQFPGFSAVEEAEVQALQVAVETRLEVKSHGDAHASGEVATEELGKAECNGDGGTGGQNECEQRDISVGIDFVDQEFGNVGTGDAEEHDQNAYQKGLCDEPPVWAEHLEDFKDSAHG